MVMVIRSGHSRCSPSVWHDTRCSSRSSSSPSLWRRPPARPGCRAWPGRRCAWRASWWRRSLWPGCPGAGWPREQSVTFTIMLSRWIIYIKLSSCNSCKSMRGLRDTFFLMELNKASCGGREGTAGVKPPLEDVEPPPRPDDREGRVSRAPGYRKGLRFSWKEPNEEDDWRKPWPHPLWGSCSKEEDWEDSGSLCWPKPTWTRLPNSSALNTPNPISSSSSCSWFSFFSSWCSPSPSDWTSLQILGSSDMTDDFVIFSCEPRFPSTSDIAWPISCLSSEFSFSFSSSSSCLSSSDSSDSVKLS